MSEPATAALAATSIRTGYGKVPVLEDVSVDVQPGEIVAVVGPNGAGKTTLLRALSGELPLTAGTVVHGDTDVSRRGVRERLLDGVVHIPEHRHLFRNLSVEENLQLGAAATRRIRGKVLQAQMDRVVALFPVLGERLHSHAGTLSGGQQQMLAIGRGLMSDPKVLLLDEPSLGLAPSVVERIMGAFVELAAEGAAVLLVEQFVESALDIAHRGYVLRGGHVRLAGLSSELLADPDALAVAYFGPGGQAEAILAEAD